MKNFSDIFNSTNLILIKICFAILSKKRIASCTYDRSIRIWDVESGDCIKILNGHTNHALSIVKHSNECVLSGSLDKTFKLWNFQTGDCLHTLKGHSDFVFCTKLLCEEKIISGSGERIKNLVSKNKQLY